jgi:hypothetical protein
MFRFDSWGGGRPLAHGRFSYDGLLAQRVDSAKAGDLMKKEYVRGLVSGWYPERSDFSSGYGKPLHCIIVALAVKKVTCLANGQLRNRSELVLNHVFWRCAG